MNCLVSIIPIPIVPILFQIERLKEENLKSYSKVERCFESLLLKVVYVRNDTASDLTEMGNTMLDMLTSNMNRKRAE